MAESIQISLNLFCLPFFLSDDHTCQNEIVVLVPRTLSNEINPNKATVLPKDLTELLNPPLYFLVVVLKKAQPIRFLLCYLLFCSNIATQFSLSKMNTTAR